MSTLKEQLDAEIAERNRPVVPKITTTVSTPNSETPNRAEYIKSAEAIQEKRTLRGKPARPSKKSKGR